MILIPAVLKDEALIADMDRHRNDQHFNLWWLGQSGFLLQWKGKRVLIDPYLSDSLTKKYADTDKQHIRMSERVVDPQSLKDISIVTASHNHTDHLDAETLIPVIKNNPGIDFIIPEANRQFVADRVQCDPSFPIGLSDNKKISVGDFTFYGIAAKHNEIERDDRGNCKFMGYVVEFGQWRIYHSGDTLYYDGMIDILKPYHIDVALLPINGNDPARGVAGNLDYREAARLGKEIGAKYVIPCHYSMFTFNTEDPEKFVKEAQTIDQAFTVLQHGERWSSSILT